MNSRSGAAGRAGGVNTVERLMRNRDAMCMRVLPAVLRLVRRLAVHKNRPRGVIHRAGGSGPRPEAAYHRRVRPRPGRVAAEHWQRAEP